MRFRRVFLITAALLLIAPAAAQAEHHLIKISEVYPGSMAAPGVEFVELRMYDPFGEENLMTYNGGSSVSFYDEDGNETASGTFTQDVANGDNQRLVLVGTPGVEAAFGVKPDLVMNVVADTPAAGGSACFNSVGFGASLDCVAWGSMITQPTFNAAPTSPFGPPEPTIPDGSSLNRTFVSNVPPTNNPTILDPGDDKNNSMNDFYPASPTPCPNSHTQPAETCVAPDSDGDGVPDPADQCPNQAGIAPSGCPMVTVTDNDGDGVENRADECPEEPGPAPSGCPLPPDTTPADTTAPDTTISTSPQNRLNGAAALYRFSSNESSVTFQCKVDRKPFKPCTSPFRIRRLREGRHSFKVKATDAAGNVDATPASDRFRVV